METMTKNIWQPLPKIVLPSPVFTLAAGHNGIWAGGTGGVAWYPGPVQESIDQPGNEDGSRWQTRNSALQISLVTALTYIEGLLLAGSIEGIAYSQDEGRHWRQADLEDGVAAITAFALSPHFSVDHTAVAATIENGILRTDDGGLSWTNASFGLENFEVTALAWFTGSTVLAATSDGIYRSSNAGRAWRRVYAGEELGIDTIAYLSDKILLATMENGDLLRSVDSGTHWSIDESGLHDIHILSLLIPPTQHSRETLFVGTFERGLLCSHDAGQHWETVYNDVVLSLIASDTTLYAGTNTGISVSVDAGQTWRGLPYPPIHDLRHLFVYKGQPLLSGAYAGVTHYTGFDWQILTGLPQILTATAIAPDDSLLLSSAEGFTRISVEDIKGYVGREYNGEAHAYTQSGPYGNGQTIGLLTFRKSGSSWQAWAASEDGRLLLRSDDRGTTWQSLQPPFGILPLVTLQAFPQRLVAATYDPRQYHVCIWSSLDDGETWERGLEVETQWPLVATCADPPIVTISSIMLLQDASGQWNRVSIGSNSGMIRRVVSIRRNDQDNSTNTTLIALTTTDLQRSDDWGASWQQDNGELSAEQIIDIAVDETYLYVLLSGGQIARREM